MPSPKKIAIASAKLVIFGRMQAQPPEDLSTSKLSTSLTCLNSASEHWTRCAFSTVWWFLKVKTVDFQKKFGTAPKMFAKSFRQNLEDSG